eukprot:jgi/Tetstr1/449854/TSEL_036916.t2
MDAEMVTEKKLGLSLDELISSQHAKKHAVPAGPRSGNKPKPKPGSKPGPRSHQGARPTKNVIPIAVRPQGRKPIPQQRQPVGGGQKRAPGLKAVRRVPATSPARLQKLGGGAARYNTQAQQTSTAQLRTNRLQAHQAVGAAARQAAIAEKRGLKPMAARTAVGQGQGVRVQATPLVADLAAGAKWKITIANDKAGSSVPAPSIVMPGQQNGGHKRGNAMPVQRAASPAVSQRSFGGRGGRGGASNANHGGGGLSDRFSKLKPAAPAVADGSGQGRATRNAAGVVMPF